MKQFLNDLTEKIKSRWEALKERRNSGEGFKFTLPRLSFRPNFSKEAFEEKTRNITRTLTQATASLKSGINSFDASDPLASLEKLKNALLGGSWLKWAMPITILWCIYLLAGLTAAVVEGFLPEPPAPRDSPAMTGTAGKGKVTEYELESIVSRNLFNSQGLIYGEGAAPTQETAPQDLPPVKTTLSLNLVGTVIFMNPLRSVGTIEDKSINGVYTVRVDDEVPGKIRIRSIEARKIVFLNIQSNRYEYVDIPEDISLLGTKVPSPKTTQLPPPQSKSGFNQVSANRFMVARKEVEAALTDLNNVLTQARAVPNFENGVPSGYKLFQIVPNSIYDKIGLKNEDVLTGMNGEPINDPGKAFQLLSELKTSNHLELKVKRNGKETVINYDIN